MPRFVLIIGSALVVLGIGLVAFLRVKGEPAPAYDRTQRTPLPSETEAASNLRKVPDLIFADYNGRPVGFADFAGKILVINSWTSWCPFCLKELPDFALVQKEFGDQVVIVAIDRVESRDVAKNYTDKLGVTPALTFLLDPSDSFYTAIGGFSMPETVFVDKEGFIREHKRGPMDIVEMRQRIKNLLAPTTER